MSDDQIEGYISEKTLLEMEAGRLALLKHTNQAWQESNPELVEQLRNEYSADMVISETPIAPVDPAAKKTKGKAKAPAAPADAPSDVPPDAPADDAQPNLFDELAGA